MRNQRVREDSFQKALALKLKILKEVPSRPTNKAGKGLPSIGNNRCQSRVGGKEAEGKRECPSPQFLRRENVATFGNCIELYKKDVNQLQQLVEYKALFCFCNRVTVLLLSPYGLTISSLTALEFLRNAGQKSFMSPKQRKLRPSSQRCSRQLFKWESLPLHPQSLKNKTKQFFALSASRSLTLYCQAIWQLLYSFIFRKSDM